jgi:hypothetical protein
MSGDDTHRADSDAGSILAHHAFDGNRSNLSFSLKFNDAHPCLFWIGSGAMLHRTCRLANTAASTLLIVNNQFIFWHRYLLLLLNGNINYQLPSNSASFSTTKKNKISPPAQRGEGLKKLLYL